MSRLTKATKKIIKVVDKHELTAGEFKDVTKRVREKCSLRIEKPRRTVDIDYFNDADLKLFMKSAVGKGRYLMVRTMYETAMRVTAFTQLRLCDVRLDERQMFVRRAKGNKQRIIPVHVDLIELLSDHISSRRSSGAAETDPLFPAQSGGFYSRRRMQQIITDIGKAAGLHCYPHKLRKTRAMWLLGQKMPIEAISQFLGHEDTSVTEKFYARMGVTMVQDAFDEVYRRIETMSVVREPAAKYGPDRAPEARNERAVHQAAKVAP